MAEVSKIQWTDATFNPWRGCTKVSAGCAHCYAETQSHRNPKVLGVWGANGTRPVASEAYWRGPERWNREAQAAGRRRRVFCASLADVFEDRDDLAAPRRRLFELIFQTPMLDWLVLTKRPDIARRELGPNNGMPPLFPNLWLGTSVENQETAVARVPILLDTNATIRFISYEPALGPVFLDARMMVGGEEFLDALRGVRGPTCQHLAIPPCTTGKIHWVIVGGESGSGARPFNVAWARSIVAQCREARVPVFVKQLGKLPATMHRHEAEPTWHPKTDPNSTLFKALKIARGGWPLDLRHPKGGDPSEWPEDLRVREFPMEKNHAT